MQAMTTAVHMQAHGLVEDRTLLRAAGRGLFPNSFVREESGSPLMPALQITAWLHIHLQANSLGISKADGRYMPR